MVKTRVGDRFAASALVISLVILLAGVAAPAQAQSAEPSPGDLPDVPIRTLVDIPVPAEPYLPTAPEEPEVIAEHWLAATSDEERRDIVLDVLSGIGLGVYTMDGTPILFGAETSIEDLWLYDFEVALLAADPVTAPATTVADIAVSLEAVVHDDAGQPIEASALAELIRAATEAAQSEPQDPVGFPLRLARELELAASGRDLALAVPVDEPLTSLATALIELDILVPLAARDRPVVAAASGIYMPVAARISRRSAGTLRVAAAPQPRTAQICGRIASWAGNKSWDIGKLGATMIVGGVRLTGLTPPAQAAHYLLLKAAVQVTTQVNTDRIHYRGHGAVPDKFIYQIKVSLRFKLPPDLIACGSLAGLRLPRDVQGANVTWRTGILDQHGSVLCPPDACLKTDANGRAKLTFTPKTEAAPAGLGPIEHDRTIVGNSVNYLLQLGNAMGVIPLQSSFGFVDLEISWHRDYRLELDIDSEIQGTGMLRFVATAKGRIPLVPPEEEGELLWVVDDLKVKTSPRPANGCKGQSSVKGQGVVAMAVVEVAISPDQREVALWVNPAGEGYPDRITRPACSRLARAVTKFSTWEHHFIQSHTHDLTRPLGFELSGWTWKADEETFRSGGLLATLDYPELCPLKQFGCNGLTHFKLYVYPAEG